MSYFTIFAFMNEPKATKLYYLSVSITSLVHKFRTLKNIAISKCGNVGDIIELTLLDFN